MENEVIKTKIGLFIRTDDVLGTIVFSPYSGLFFAIAKTYSKDVLNYCMQRKNNLPQEIAEKLAIGLDLKRHSFHIRTHWLPSPADFPYLDLLPERPITINWLISNKCCFCCNYCYANEIIDNKVKIADVKQVAQDILSVKPVVVVFSGGEPLLEKEHLIDAINIIGNKAGIIIDTNGYLFDDDLAKLFKKYHAVVRISLDTLQDDINQKIRPAKTVPQNTLSTIINNINKYKETGIPILVHTVVSSVNKNSLDDLYDKLPTLGVNGWRIFSVINPNDQGLQEKFKKLMTFGGCNSIPDAHKNIKDKLKIFERKHCSKSNFSLQIIENDGHKNSVILVLPSGKFVTEHTLQPQKREIQINSLFGINAVDIKEHYERYLGKFNL